MIDTGLKLIKKQEAQNFVILTLVPFVGLSAGVRPHGKN
jgi:hypothetical protein